MKTTITATAEVGQYFHRAAQVFDTFYDDQRTPLMRWVDRNFRRDMYERFDRTFAAIMPLEGKTVLDIGCGSGPYAVECAIRGARQVLGIDLAPGMLQLARERAERLNLGKVCSFVEGAFPDAAPKEQFDHAIVMGVMDYIADKPAFLRTLVRCTRVSAAISFPSDHWMRGTNRRIRYRIKKCPLWLYRENQIRDLMKLAGFRRIEIDKIRGAGMDFVAVGHV